MSEEREFIGGHKTFDTGEIDPETGFPILRHEPLTREEAEAICEAVEKAAKDRAEKMPDEKSAIAAMMDAHTRLKELGWSEAIYCPKDGSRFQVVEAGSTGIHECYYSGEWSQGSYLIAESGDLWPSHPVLFKLYPEDQEKYDAKMKEARERFSADPTTPREQ